MMKNKQDPKSAPYQIWGENLDGAAVRQMEDACSLPVSVKGALMPDAHQGYGLPIGGVLAVDGAVIPYAVGVDIACRMKMSILDIPFPDYEKRRGKFKIALETETRFGVGESFARPKEHRVMDEDWSFCHPVGSLKDKAWKQLGTSGAGNHFAEFGRLFLEKKDLGLEKGEYLALLTHSGSRGAGADIAKHYSTLAKRLHPELPKKLNDLAWLDLKSSEGREYWLAMELMGKYSGANHDIIHQGILSHLGAISVLTLENHHNFAWKSQLGSREVIVHRKGATPAGKGVLGVIPGTMASPGFVVRGLGNQASLCSAAHGAGRKMSRTAAMKKYDWSDMTQWLVERGVTLISAGIDEAPMAYKCIEAVMDQQKDLVEILARFDPKLVKMAPPDRYARKGRKRR
ncbi:MAG: RtcB family protein [Proteobacteria bacterium]|nr:RtcB family protein [Pseudomonadota bacterium]